MSASSRWLVPLLGLAALSGVSLAAYLREAGRRGAAELMHPTPTQPDEAPGAYGLAPETVAIPVDAHVTLGAWLVPARVVTQRAVLLFHGHSAARSQLLPYARFLCERYHCLLVDFRNAGSSTPGVSSMGLREGEDVAAAAAYMRARGFGPLAGWAMSMGGAALLRAAAADASICAVVTDSTFARVQNPIAKRARDRAYPFPGLVARAIVHEASRRLGAPIAPPDPLDLVGQLAPRGLLIVHGDADETSPLANALALFEAAGEPKELLVVPGAGHTRSHRCLPDAYEHRVMGFLQRSMDQAEADRARGPRGLP